MKEEARGGERNVTLGTIGTRETRGTRGTRVTKAKREHSCGLREGRAGVRGKWRRGMGVEVLGVGEGVTPFRYVQESRPPKLAEARPLSMEYVQA